MTGGSPRPTKSSPRFSPCSRAGGELGDHAERSAPRAGSVRRVRRVRSGRCARARRGRRRDRARRGPGGGAVSSCPRGPSHRARAATGDSSASVWSPPAAGGPGPPDLGAEYELVPWPERPLTELRDEVAWPGRRLGQDGRDELEYLAGETRGRRAVRRADRRRGALRGGPRRHGRGRDGVLPLGLPAGARLRGASRGRRRSTAGASSSTTRSPARMCPTLLRSVALGAGRCARCSTSCTSTRATGSPTPAGSSSRSSASSSP